MQNTLEVFGTSVVQVMAPMTIDPFNDEHAANYPEGVPCHILLVPMSLQRLSVPCCACLSQHKGKCVYCLGDKCALSLFYA